MCVFFVLLNVLPKSPGIKKTICCLHGSCSIRFLQTGHWVFPAKSRVWDPSSNAFHFILFSHKTLNSVEGWLMNESDAFSQKLKWFSFSSCCTVFVKTFKGGNSESSINILISVQHRLAADWSETKIDSFILSYWYCQKIWGNQIFLRDISKGL